MYQCSTKQLESIVAHYLLNEQIATLLKAFLPIETGFSPISESHHGQGQLRLPGAICTSLAFVPIGFLLGVLIAALNQIAVGCVPSHRFQVNACIETS